MINSSIDDKTVGILCIGS